MGSSRSIGSLSIDLIAKIGGWTQGLSKAERELDTRTKRMNRMAYNFGRSFGASIKSAAGSFLAFAGVTVSIGAVVTSLKSAIDRADELRDASIRLGVGVDVLSKWSYAAKQTGTDLDGLSRGLKILSKNAIEALNPKSQQAGLFSALGISKESLTDLNVLLPQLADAFQKIPDGATKAAVAQQLFGKSGLDLIEFLNQGSKGIKEFGDKLEKLGGVVTPEAAAAADKFNDDLDDLKTAFGGVANKVAQDMLPALDGFINDMNSPSMRQGLATVIEGLAKIITFAVQGASAVGGLAHALSIAFSRGSDLTAYDDLLDKYKQINNEIGSRQKGGLFGNAPDPISKLLGLPGGDSLDDLIRQRDELNKKMDVLRKGFANDSLNATHPVNDHHSGKGQFANVNTPGLPAISDALAAFLGGDTGGGGNKGGGGKSQQQKDADQLTASFQRMNDSLNEQIALFGKTSETAKERYELEFGELAKLDPARKAELTAQLDKIDQMHAEKDLQEQLGKVEQERQDQIDRAVENADKQIEDMQFELSLLGLTNKEREKEIALRYAGADATEAQRAAISSLSDQMDAAQQKASFYAEVQHDLSDSIYDFVTGAKSAKDAVKDFFDSVAQYITRMIADKWAEKIAGMFSGASSGSSGGGSLWGEILGAFFSSGSIGVTPGAASGGWRPGNSMFEVNERGFEMASVGGRDYMLTGSSPVQITPNHALPRAGATGLTQNFYLPGPADLRTRTQLAQQTAVAGRTAMARNGR